MARLSFEDDEPIQCDCGCWIEAGETFCDMSIRVWNNDTQMLEKVSFTSCLDTNHVGRVLEDNLNRRKYMNFKEVSLNTAFDKELIYADMQED